MKTLTSGYAVAEYIRPLGTRQLGHCNTGAQTERARQHRACQSPRANGRVGMDRLEVGKPMGARAPSAPYATPP